MYARQVRVLVGVLFGLVVTAVQADDGVTLGYKRTKGDKAFSLNKEVTKQSQTVMGMTFETLVEMESISSNTVDDIDEKGNYHMSEKTERIKVKGDFGAAGGTFEFDSKSSERDKASQIGVHLTPLLERMSGAVIQVVVTPQGEVK